MKKAPSISTWLVSKVSWYPKALPVRRWHDRQWQTETRTGSPLHTAFSPPQLHSAVLRIIGLLYTGPRQ
jgi:hypothetical protein